MRLAVVLVLVAVAAFFIGRATVGQGSYQAGRDDAFSGFDGGWALGAPYAVTLKRGGNGITYAFARRWALEPGFDYRACGHAVCSRPAP